VYKKICNAVKEADDQEIDKEEVEVDYSVLYYEVELQHSSIDQTYLHWINR